MRYSSTALLVIVLGVGLWALGGCDVNGVAGGGSVWSALFGGSGSGGDTDETAGTGQEQTVGSVSPDNLTDPSPGQPLPDSGAINARVRNLSAKAADVTLRFLRNGIVVHLTFLRVPARTTTLVVGPEQADRLEAGGTNEDGEPLPEGVFLYGVDFDEGTEAVYQIGGGTPEPDDGDADGEPDTPGTNDPPQITMLAPAEDVTVAVGSVLLSRWTDADPDDNALIVLSLRSVSDPGAAPIPLAPPLAENGDGAEDSLLLVLEDVPPGVYELVGSITDGLSSAESVAPGRITVFEDPQNAAPTLAIVQPSAQVVVILGEALFISWTDEDDGAAMITFYLDANPVNFDGGEIQITPPLAEDPDGVGNDTGHFGITGIAPGEYDLVGVINDGELIGTARATGTVIVVERESPLSPPPASTGCTTDFECSDGDPCTEDYCNVTTGHCHHIPYDCNENGIADCVEIAQGSAADVNGNSVPDDCDCPLAPAPSDPDPSDEAVEVSPEVVLTWGSGGGQALAPGRPGPGGDDPKDAPPSSSARARGSFALANGGNGPNFTTDDNENNLLTGTADGDMDEYLFRTSPLAPIEFNILVTETTVTSAQLLISGWDVDETGRGTYVGEIDEVYFNETYLGTLTGANDEWSTTVLNVNPSLVTLGNNLVVVTVDELEEGWAVEVDWGQLVLNGAGGQASVRYALTDRATYQPGDTVVGTVEVDTTLASQGVRVETNLLDPNGTNIAGTSRTYQTLDGDYDPFDVSLAIPPGSPNGTYQFQVLVYDSTTLVLQDLVLVPFVVDESCATTYDVYLGTSPSTMTAICQGISAQSCDAGELDGLVYYWQVVAVTPAGETPGPVWSFEVVDNKDKY